MPCWRSSYQYPKHLSAVEEAALPTHDLKDTRHTGAMAASPGGTQSMEVMAGTGPVTEVGEGAVGAVGGAVGGEEHMAPLGLSLSTKNTVH